MVLIGLRVVVCFLIEFQGEMMAGENRSNPPPEAPSFLDPLRKIKINEFMFFCFAILFVQAISLYLFGDIRFSSGIPGEHWGMFFVKRFPVGVWYFVRNGWVFYMLYFLLFWLRVKSLTICVAGFFTMVIIIAIFNFYFAPHSQKMFFVFDAIGLVISIAFISAISIIGSTISKLVSKFSCEDR